EIYGNLIADLRRAGAQELYLLFDMSDLPANGPAVIIPLGTIADEAALVRVLKETSQKSAAGGLPWLRGNVCLKLHGALVFAGQPACQRLSTLEAVSDPRLETAFQAAGGSPASILLLPYPDMRRVFDEAIASLSSGDGEGAPRAFRDGLQWGVL